MSITFWSDPSFTATTTYRTIDDFFNPLKNTFCIQYPSVYTHGQVRVTDFFKILNQLFCDANLTDWSFIQKITFLGRITESEYASFLLLADAVPADKRWMLAFLFRDGAINNVYALKYQTFEHHELIRSRTIIRTSNNTKSLPVYQTLAEGVAKLPDIIKTYEDFFEDKQEIFWDTSANGAISQMIRSIILFCVDYPFVRMNEDHIKPSQARSQLANQPSENISITPRFTGRELDHISICMKASKNNKSPLYNVRSYSFDVLNILPYPLKEQKENKPLLVGVELEVSTDYSMKELVDAADDPFFCGKQDSSINGNKSNAIELVTAPASIKYLKRQYALWFNNLDYTKFDTSTKTNNGMHVHVGREHFRNEVGEEDKNHIRNFCWFINHPANIDFFVYLSERGSLAGMSPYSPFYSFSRGSSKVRALKSVDSTIGSGRFRGATNFKGGWENAKTIEVRIFKGIVSYACIVKNLEVVDSVFHFTKSLTGYRNLNLKGYLAWLKQTPSNKYSVLKKFIDQVDLQKMLIASEVKDVLFNEDDPEKILTLLKKAPFKITNEHVTFLNKGRKRTFTLDKETGELQLTSINRSKISFLDKEIAARYLRAS